MHNSKNKHNVSKIKGFSIVELMIAVFIGVIILTGLVQVFDTSSKMNRTQNGLARIQENGRYAVSLMKQTIEQTGYQYCMGESNDPAVTASQPTKYAWDIRSLPFVPGVAVGPFDPSLMLHGHECDDTTCSPALDSLGSNESTVVPDVGEGQGDRIAGTDVITFRYISGAGREVENVAGGVIGLTAWENNNPPDTLLQSGQILFVNCNDSAPVLISKTAETDGSISYNTTQGNLQNTNLAKVYDMQRDFSTITYYVANDIVDGRDIPTLYSNVNGVTNAIIQGVDDFDIIYEVMDNGGGITFLDAAGVQGFPVANCWPAIISTNGTTVANTAGCGWRSVVSTEIHLLLNTIYNSTNNENEQFRYSPYGNGFYDKTDTTLLVSDIEHYSMHRKEFYTTISLKNVMH